LIRVPSRSSIKWILFWLGQGALALSVWSRIKRHAPGLGHEHLKNLGWQLIHNLNASGAQRPVVDQRIAQTKIQKLLASLLDLAAHRFYIASGHGFRRH
jgi:hypothetical protein